MTYRMKRDLDPRLIDELGSFVDLETEWSEDEVKEDATNYGMTVSEFVGRYLEVI